MEEVNEENRKDDLPEVEMGIGLHTGQVVLGNIGSPERMKYGVVGRHVNLTSRIQSYTTGGQILITDATRREAGSSLKLGKQTGDQGQGHRAPRDRLARCSASVAATGSCCLRPTTR